MIKILLFARKYNKNYPNNIGGVIVSSENLIKSFNANNVKYSIIDTNKTIYLHPLMSLFFIYVKAMFKIVRADHIALNLNEKELIYILPIIVWYAKLMNKKCSLRVFGGNLDTIYNNCNFTQKILLDYGIKQCAILFLQTKRLVKKFSYYRNVIWLPTCRFQINCKIRANYSYTKKYVYIGHIREEKGVKDILKSAELLSNDYEFDFYGHLCDIKENVFNKNCTYRGVVKPENVLNVLSQYDVLILPSYWKGEGYAGVIIEALSLGLPVIASNIKNFQEIIDDGINGYLVSVKNPLSIVNAIKKIKQKNYKMLSKLAYKSFKQFDCECVYTNYLNNIKINI